MNLLKEHFRAFCTYRFYNSHSKAMALRREEIRKNVMLRANPRRHYKFKDKPDDNELEIENEHEFDQIFLSRETIKIQSLKKKVTNHRESVVLLKEALNQFSMLSRSNKFNENDIDEEQQIKKLLEEDNVVVSSWINDMGMSH